MNKKIFTIILAMVFAQIGWAQTHADTLMAQLRDPKCKKVFVVSHRADWRNAPENSLQAIQNCIDMGVDMVEIDLKKTKDGELVLLHDSKIDRTLTKKGKPEEYTLAELKEMRLRGGAGHKTEHQIPTFRETMLLAKGKILVNVDKGYDYFDDVYKILEETGTLDQCIIKAGKPYKEVKAEKPVALDKMLFMPCVKLTRDWAKDVINDWNHLYKPFLYEVSFDTDDKNTHNLIHLAQEKGAKVFINAMWPELCGGHHDDRAVDRGEKEQSWGWIVKRGIKLIQTDRPQQLLEYLREKNLHE